MLALTSISHLATLCYEKQADPRPRYPAVLEHKRLVMDNSAAAIQCVANGHATIIPRVFPSLPPSLKTLASLVDTLEKHGQTIQAAIVTNKRFMLPNNPMAPVDSIYHVHQPKVQPMTPKEALQCATSWKTHQIALTTTIRLDLDIPTLMHNHATTMDNHPTALHVATCPDLLHPLHYTTHPRLFIQLAGRKRYFIVTPDHSFSGLYPFPVHHTYDRYSMVDFDHPRVDQQWPRALDIRGATATLAPGHALYIPAYTWVSTQSLDVYAAVAVVPLQQPQLPLIPYTRALGALQDKVLVERVPLGPSVWVVPPLSAAGGAAALAVSRVVEAIMADALGGVDAVRTWLLHAAHGADAVHADLSTVMGHRVRMACHEVRVLIDAWFGPGAWRVLLVAMCEDRLVSTAWLDEHAPRHNALGAPAVVGRAVAGENQHPLRAKYPMFFP